jgi:hypothetical protein
LHARGAEEGLLDVGAELFDERVVRVLLLEALEAEPPLSRRNR